MLAVAVYCIGDGLHEGGTAMAHCWPRSRDWGLITALVIGLALAGCGQKGPLYLPDEDARTEQSQR